METLRKDGVRWAVLLTLALLAYFTLQIVQFVIYPLIWAAIIVFATWPAHRFLKRHLKWHHNTIASLFTATAIGLLLLLVLMLIDTAKDEIPRLILLVKAFSQQQQPIPLPIPWVTDWLEEWRQRFVQDPSVWQDFLKQRAPNWLDEIGNSVLFVGSNGIGLVFIFLGLFYFYRDGEQLLADVKLASHAVLGVQSDTYWKLLSSTTQAVVYGFCLTALAQGTLAGLGYWVCGLKIPILLGVLTTLLAFFPFGTPLIWGSSAIFLLATGHTTSGIGLLLWGALIVSTVDNFLRPWIISRTAKIPFFLVLIGMLGGLQTFGLIGLFLGPIFINIIRTLWLLYLHSLAPPNSPSSPEERSQ